jgi:hypothetical protein
LRWRKCESSAFQEFRIQLFFQIVRDQRRAPTLFLVMNLSPVTFEQPTTFPHIPSVYCTLVIHFTNLNCCPSVHVDSHTIITPRKYTLLLLKAPDITIYTLYLIFCPYMFQPAWVIFRGLNASAWLKLLLITIY